MARSGLRLRLISWNKLLRVCTFGCLDYITDVNLHVVVGVALLANAPERLPVKRKRPHDEVRCIDYVIVYS